MCSVIDHMMIFLVILIGFKINLVDGNHFFMNENSGNLTKYVIDTIDYVSITHPGGYMNIIYNKDSDHLTNQILQYVHKNTVSKIVVLNLNNDNRWRQMKYDSYLGYLKLMLILTNTTENVVDIINRLNSTIFYQTRSRVMIVLSSTPQPEELEEMFRIFWSKKFPLVTCLFLNGTQREIYSFNPFFDQFIQDYSYKNVSNLFYNIFKDMNGNKLNVLLLRFDDRDKIILIKHPNGTVEWKGYEIELLRSIVHKINGSAVIIPAADYILPGERDPWRQSNELNSSTAAVEIKKRIISINKIDLMSSEEIVVPEDVSGVTESLYPHSTDNMKIIMLRSQQIPYVRYLFLVYKYNVWVFFLVTIIVGTISWGITGSTLYPSWFNKFINLIRVLFGGTLPRISDNTSERIFVMVWIIYSLIISNAFTCNLASVLMQTRYYPNIDTLDELLKGGHKIIGYKTQIRELRKAFNNSQKYPLFERMIPMADEFAHVDNTKNNMTKMLWEMTDMMVMNERRAVYVTKHKIMKDRFHIVKESPLPNYTSLHVPVGSPFFYHLNSIMRRIIEAGLYQFWKNQQEHYYILNGLFYKPGDTIKNRTEANSITLKHLQAAFLMYLVGLILSLFAFIIELVVNKTNKYVKK